MPDLNSRQFTQSRLFDPGPAVPPRMTVERFLDQASWHGSANPSLPVDKKIGPLHSGTLRSAQERRNYTRFPGEEDFYYPVVPDRVYPTVIDDLEANEVAGTGDSALYEGEVDPKVTAAYRQGETLPYYNHVEDEGSVSYVSPKGSYSTVHDADLGLAEGTGWRPRPYLTKRDIAQAGQAIDDAYADPEQLELRKMRKL